MIELGSVAYAESLYNEFIDLPNLKVIELGSVAYAESLSTIIESMF